VLRKKSDSTWTLQVPILLGHDQSRTARGTGAVRDTQIGGAIVVDPREGIAGGSGVR